MESVAVVGVSSASQIEGAKSTKIENVEVSLAWLETEQPFFDEKSKSFSDFVLVRKNAFSCNYRDKSIIKLLANSLNESESDSIKYSFFGSEFSGEIISKGDNVKEFSVGDSVIPDGAYQGDGLVEYPGIPSNRTSQEVEIFHKSKLIRIPDSMDKHLAAGFTIGAQTGCGMIRRSELSNDSKILITSITSATSLYSLFYASQISENVYALGSSSKHLKMLKSMGLKELIVIDRNNVRDFQRQIFELSKNHEFDVIIDPFADTWMFSTIKCLKHFGKYVTCGFYDQNKSPNAVSSHISQLYKEFLTVLIKKNITVIGNCLGTRDDLEFALRNYKELENKMISKVYSKSDSISDFINSTFNDPNKLGKVIFDYA